MLEKIDRAKTERRLFMSALEEIRSRFRNDHFATDGAGIVIDEA